MGAMRIPVTYPMESRDGTLAKDAKLKNMVTEMIEGKPWAVKRPGIANKLELVNGGIAQGLISLNGVAYSIVGDIVYYTTLGAGSSIGTAAGGYNLTTGAPIGGSGAWTRLATTSPFSNYLDGDQPGFVLKSFGDRSLIAFGGYLFAAVAEAVDGGQWEPKIYRSSNGIGWTKVADIPYTYLLEPEWDSYAAPEMCQLVVHGGYLWLVSSQYSGVSYRSTDGSSWTRVVNTSWSHHGFSSISWNGELWSCSGGTLYHIADPATGVGTPWFISAGKFKCLFVHGGNLYGIHSIGTIVTTDGSTWSSVSGATLPSNYVSSALAVGGVVHAYVSQNFGDHFLREYTFNGTAWSLVYTHSASAGNVPIPSAYLGSTPYAAVSDFTATYQPLEMWDARLS